MYLNEDTRNYYSIDIEADGLKPTRIWCVVLQSVANPTEIWKFYGDDLRQQFLEFVETHPEAIYVGHNFISFDAPVLRRLLGISIADDRIVDTLVLSYLYYPALPKPSNMPRGTDGAHGLKAWGYRLNEHKIEHEDWSHFSPEMLARCVGDVSLTRRVYLVLAKKLRKIGFSEKSCELEHQIRVVVDKQERNGFWFNIPAAESLYADLRQKERNLASPITELFPPRLVLQNTYKRRKLKDGSDTHHYLRHIGAYPRIEDRGDEYDVYDWEEFNLGSPTQRLSRLMELGYNTDKRTKGGALAVDEESLVAFAATVNQPQVSALAEWLVTNGRANMINTWLNAVNYDDSRMHGKVFTCGAASRRMRHAQPNTANIPGNEAKYGREVRELWGVEPRRNRVLVGYDATALEGRCLAHYLNSPEAAELLLRGDLHQLNADATGYDRRSVKTDFYAFLYGASNTKLGSHHAGGASVGKRIREALMVNVPGLKRLVEKVQAEQRSGWLRCIDGGFVRCDSPHAALNYKLQPAGGIIMKQASIYIDERTQGWDQLKVGDIHDEGQHDVDQRIAEEFGCLAVQAIRDAGETFNTRVPMDGDYKIGQTWAETH